MDQYFVGVDFGQSRDFTAIAVVEYAETTGDWDAVMFAYRKEVSLNLRYLERLPLGTPYVEVAEKVARITTSADLAGRCSLALDGTGVGRPVVELIRQAKPGCNVLAVNITSGLKETYDGGFYGVPKRDLILHLQVLLQCQLLQIAKGLEYGEDLVKELTAMQVKITPSGNEQYGSWREGTHDDLVFAVALAAWNAHRAYPNHPAGGEQWWRNRHEAEAARLFKKKLKKK
jgi:hypothetical protein